MGNKNYKVSKRGDELAQNFYILHTSVIAAVFPAPQVFSSLLNMFYTNLLVIFVGLTVATASDSCVCNSLPVSDGVFLTRYRKCNALLEENQLANKVFCPGTEGYEASLKTYYSANAAQHSWCTVLPETTEDVQAVSRIISRHHCPFGIKAGGHSAWKGSSAVEHGVTVDFGTTAAPMDMTTTSDSRRQHELYHLRRDNWNCFYPAWCEVGLGV